MSRYPREDSNGSTELPDLATVYENISSSLGTISGTVDARNATLRLIIDAWSSLSDQTINEVLRITLIDRAQFENVHGTAKKR